VVFITLEDEASYTARRRPKTPKVVMRYGKVCKGPLCLRKERNKN
jgi:hypothetical protein